MAGHTTRTTTGLTWTRSAPGVHLGSSGRPGGRRYQATRDHRPGVTGWHLTHGPRHVATCTTLAAAKAAAAADQAAR